MSQLTIKLSDKADALIAQLQKEIFNRRRKKVSPAGVVETLVESGAKSQSDKRFATSWKNLLSDIEKAAKEANAHGVKPVGLSDAEWALILSHRSRSATKGRTARARIAAKPSVSSASSDAEASPVPSRRKTAAAASARKAKAAKTAAKAAPAARPASRKKESAGGSSAARRMAKAVSRLNAPGAQAPTTAPTANGAAALV